MKDNRPPLKVPLPVSPVFILGAPRSGTSAIRAVLAQILGYEGHHEGHVLPLLFRISSMFRQQQAYIDGQGFPFACTTWHNFNHQHVLERIKELFLEEINRLYPHSWCDKTPGHEMIDWAPALLELYPQAFFLFIHRRGIENVLSQQRKFPSRDFAECCHIWDTTMKAWWRLRSKLHGRYLELEQFRLENDTEDVVRLLLGKLQLDESLTEEVTSRLLLRTIERTTTEPGRLFSLEETGWTEGQKQTFVRICGPSMRAYRYPLDLSSPPDSSDFFLPRAVEAENIFNSWFDVPYSPCDTFNMHPNWPGTARAAVIFSGINKGAGSELMLRTVLNRACKNRVYLGILVRASNAGEWHRNEFYLRTGDETVQVALPSAQVVDLRFEIDTLPGAADFYNCGVEVSGLRFILGSVR